MSLETKYFNQKWAHIIGQKCQGTRWQNSLPRMLWLCAPHQKQILHRNSTCSHTLMKFLKHLAFDMICSVPGNAAFKCDSGRNHLKHGLITEHYIHTIETQDQCKKNVSAFSLVGAPKKETKQRTIQITPISSPQQRTYIFLLHQATNRNRCPTLFMWLHYGSSQISSRTEHFEPFSRSNLTVKHLIQTKGSRVGRNVEHVMVKDK